jgi:hypothetical protein
MPVPVAGQPVPGRVSARNPDGCGAGVVRVRGGRGGPARTPEECSARPVGVYHSLERGVTYR